MRNSFGKDWNFAITGQSEEALWNVFAKTKGCPLVERPKAIGDIRGVSYIYALFYRFGFICVPDHVKEKMEMSSEGKLL